MPRLAHGGAALNSLDRMGSVMGRSRCTFSQFDASKAVKALLVNCASVETLPLFATDSVLGTHLLGPDRVQEFKQMIPML
jgi:hypothetical protein